MHLDKGRGVRCAALGLALLAMAGCSSSDGSSPPPTDPYGGGEIAGTSVDPGDALSTIAARLDAVLTIGKNTITADALAKRLVNPPPGAWSAATTYAQNDLVTFGGASYRSLKAANLGHAPDEASSTWWAAASPPAQAPIAVVDVRDAADFARGHIPGSINVPLGTLPTVLLQDPSSIPTTELAIASYHGADGNMATLLINAVRYDPTSRTIPGFALGIMGGITAWSLDRELAPGRFDDDAGVRRVENGAVVKSASAPTSPTYAYPSLGAFSPAADTTARKILVRARAYLQSLEQEAVAAGVPHREAFWTTFVRYGALRGTADEPQVLSVRSAADYNARGHVPGAVNIPWGAVARLQQTKLVDPSRKVFVYCYTGHTGGQATMALGILGYQARNLLYGLNGWTADANVLSVSLQSFDRTRAFDFPQHDWPGAPASLVGWVPPRAGCAACHTSHIAQWYDLTCLPPVGAVPEVASEGEG